MRMRNLIIGDIKFQIKYGFYFVYAVFTIFYICFLLALPASIREKAGTIMIYTDPAALGLFFMGAIILLEKSQRVLDSITVSPVKVSEYIISKVVTLGIIATVVAVLISIVSGIQNFAAVIVGTLLGSILLSLIGLMVASKINSLNQFLIGTIPFELICSLPAMVYFFGYKKPFMLLHPGCIIISMLEGEGKYFPQLILLLCVWILITYLITYKVVKNMFQSVGGVKL